MKIRSTNQSNPIRRLLTDHRLILVAVEPHFGHRIVNMHHGAKLNSAPGRPERSPAQAPSEPCVSFPSHGSSLSMDISFQ